MDSQIDKKTKLIARFKKPLLVLAGVVVLYTIIGFLVAPPILKSVLSKKLTEALHRTVTIQTIRLNPYVLSISIKGLLIKNLEKTDTFVSFDEFYANLQSFSLFKLAPVLKEVKLRTPFIKISRLDENNYNFTDLLNTKTSESPEAEDLEAEEDREPFRFSVSNIQILDCNLELQDDHMNVKHQINDLDFRVPFLSNFSHHSDIHVEPGFSAVINGTPVSFAGKTKPFHDTLETIISLDIKRLDLTHYISYVPVKMNFDLASAFFGLGGEISYIDDPALGGRLSFNGNLLLESIETRDKNGTLLVSLPSVSVTSDGSEIFSKNISISDVTIETPEVNVIRESTGDLNLLALIPEMTQSTEGKAETAEEEGQGGVTINMKKMSLVDGKIRFLDKMNRDEFETALYPMNLTISDFSNERDKKSNLEFSCSTEENETVNVGGTFSVNPVSIEGDLALKGIMPGRYAPYYNENTLFDIQSGSLDVLGKYRYAQNEDPERNEIKVWDLSTVISGLDLRRRSVDTSFFTVPVLSVKQISADVSDKKLVIGQFFTEKGVLNVNRSPEGEINLSKLLPQAESLSDKEETPASAESGAGEWSLKLENADMGEYTINFSDKSLSKPMNLPINHIKFNLKNISNAKDSKGAMTFGMSIPPKGEFTIGGELGINPLFANLDTKLNKLGIKEFQSYWKDKVNLVVTDGVISINGNIRVQTSEEKELAAGFKGETLVSNLSTVDARHAEDFFNAKSFYLSGMDIGYNPLRIEIDKVALSEFYSRLSIDEEGTSNIQELVVKSEADETEQADTETAKADIPLSEQPEKSFVDIKTITLQGGEIAFSDSYIDPDYSAKMTEVGGRISGLTSEETKLADVSLGGKLNNYAPLEISGEINPLRDDFYIDLGVKFKDIDLTQMTPYGSKYAGYTIHKGKLSIDLKYLIDNKKLDASNKVFIDQFTLGDRVDSPDATKLPVSLAISLLKNRNGEINLDLPISGNLDDPKFRIGGIILQVIGNILEKALTSPFALLGAMFGGGEELSETVFEAGSVELTPEVETKIGKLVEVLYDRPGLNLELEGHVDVVKDKEALRDIRFNKKIKAQKLKDMVSKGMEAPPLEDITVEEDEYEIYLKMAYDAGEFPKPRDEEGIIKELPVEEMEKLIVNHVEVTDDDLRLLAHQRAENLKGYIISSEKVEGERLFLIEPESLAPEKKENISDSRVDFRLK